MTFVRYVSHLALFSVGSSAPGVPSRTWERESQLRRRWTELPVVIMSGFSRTGIPAMDDDPATQFLEKPFTSAQLLDVLATAMGGASSITRRQRGATQPAIQARSALGGSRR
jgi:FixJ family two-component response regulator